MKQTEYWQFTFRKAGRPEFFEDHSRRGGIAEKRTANQRISKSQGCSRPNLFRKGRPLSGSPPNSTALCPSDPPLPKGLLF